jgi:hypothetical protein
MVREILRTRRGMGGNLPGFAGRVPGNGGSLRQFPAIAWEGPANLQEFPAGFGEAGGKLRERGGTVGEGTPMAGQPGTNLNALAAVPAVNPCFAKTQGDVHADNHCAGQPVKSLQELSKAQRNLAGINRRFQPAPVPECRAVFSNKP